MDIFRPPPRTSKRGSSASRIGRGMKLPRGIISCLGTHGKSSEMIKCKMVENYKSPSLNQESQRKESPSYTQN